VTDMQFLVIAQVRDSIVGEGVARLRKDVGAAVQRIAGSGKMVAGGNMGGKRALFFLLEVETSQEILSLLGGEIIDNANCDIYPIVSFEDLGKFFAEHPR
jgi:hypothetical protein